MYYVTLKKIESDHSNLRDDEIDGICYNYPIVGELFTLCAKSRDIEDGTRFITTSLVRAVTIDNSGIIFTTENSTYKLTEVSPSMKLELQEWIYTITRNYIN